MFCHAVESQDSLGEDDGEDCDTATSQQKPERSNVNKIGGSDNTKLSVIVQKSERKAVSKLGDETTDSQQLVFQKQGRKTVSKTGDIHCPTENQNKLGEP